MDPKYLSPLNELENCLKELNSTPIGRRSFLAALPLLLAACATTEKTRYREGDNQGQATNLTVNDEKRMTQEVLPKMRKDYPPIRHSGMQNYVSDLGKTLVASNGLQGNPYRYSFTVVDVPYVNAFALPAGTVFVTAPLIAMADTEAELMGVIGHEVGHIKARHTAERMYAAENSKKKNLLYSIGGTLLGGAVGYGIGKLTCPPKDKRCLEKAAKIGAGTGFLGTLLIQKYAFMQNSQEDEMEADRIGFKTSVATGYHKDYVGRFYHKLLKMEQKSKANNVPLLASVTDAMSTHPPSEKRVTQMQQMASETPEGKRAKVSSNDFDKYKRMAAVFQKRATDRAKKANS